MPAECIAALIALSINAAALLVAIAVLIAANYPKKG